MPQAKLFIIIPFYQQPHLIDAVCGNLLSLAGEIKEIKGHILLINDSPEAEDVRQRLTANWAKLVAVCSAEIVTNEQNLGFVGSSNIGLSLAAEAGADALLLNSDTLLAEGTLKEMLAVAALDPMIGFVTPRSNNATIASLPFHTREKERDFSEAFSNFQRLSPYLPRLTYAPTGIGFCLLIKNLILRDFGLLDEIYSPGYNEENDLCLRANRAGFRAVLANKAFCFHESSSSFQSEKKIKLEEKNSRILQERYPEYLKAVGEYLEGPEFIFEQLLATRLRREGAEFSLALDFSHFGNYHNGTFEFGLALARAIYVLKDPRVKLAVICPEEAARFHRLEELLPAAEIYTPESEQRFEVVLKTAQIFQLTDCSRIAKRGLYNFVIMLDTIALDCAYLRSAELESLWHFTAEWADGLLYISEFSRSQFELRFPAVLKTPQLACQLSVRELDYKERETPLAAEQEGSEDSAKVLGEIPLSYVLLVGNHFHHKFIKPAAEFLLSRFPQLRLVCLGRMEDMPRAVLSLSAGKLSERQISELYAGAEFVIFPSQYEGFGFPIVQALSRGKTVLARDCSLNRQIGERWDGGGRLLLFQDLKQLAELLECLIGSPLEQTAGPSGNNPDLLKADSLTSLRLQTKQGQVTYGWREMAQSVIEFIARELSLNPSAEKSRQRLFALRDIEKIGGFEIPSTGISEKSGLRGELSELKQAFSEQQALVELLKRRIHELNLKVEQQELKEAARRRPERKFRILS